ncbi:hypothetical protein PanNE5_18570 [Pandoraea sp. NE5]|uniref:hypothetical protein n=1 Tax=Pandoraea sp. NE5 TaxID=2904129 RepID=UPI0021C33EEB|nr:hypothetical protein [Pandoraea sp. NE5]BDD92417.1 hypothetical protein PanNE5_18570 [Pandoraea sp. NE5]
MSVDWSFWLGLHTVEEWQACALSLQMDPDYLRLDQYANAYARPESLPVFDAFCFPTAELEEKFKKRLRLLASTLSAGGLHFRRPRDVPRGHGERKIYLSDFATWALSIVAWDGLPPQLVALAKSAGQSSAGSAVEPPSVPNGVGQRTGSHFGFEVKLSERESAIGAGSTPTCNAAPELKIGSNAKAAVVAYIGYWAPKLRGKDDTAQALAEKIFDHIPAGCSGERGAITVPSIVRNLPAGLTGGRKGRGVKSTKK